MCLCDTPGRRAWSLLVVASCVAVPGSGFPELWMEGGCGGVTGQGSLGLCCSVCSIQGLLHSSGIPDSKIPSLRVGVLSWMSCCCHFGSGI